MFKNSVMKVLFVRKHRMSEKKVLSERLNILLSGGCFMLEVLKSFDMHVKSK